MLRGSFSAEKPEQLLVVIKEFILVSENDNRFKSLTIKNGYKLECYE